MEEEDIIKIYEKIIKENNFDLLKDEDFFKEIEKVERIILIEDIKIWKGKKLIWKGKIKEISVDSFIQFFIKEISVNSYRNYIIKTIPESSFVYTINEDGLVLKYSL